MSAGSKPLRVIATFTGVGLTFSITFVSVGFSIACVTILFLAFFV
jgi:hypothetical protein